MEFLKALLPVVFIGAFLVPWAWNFAIAFHAFDRSKLPGYTAAGWLAICAILLNPYIFMPIATYLLRDAAQKNNDPKSMQVVRSSIYACGALYGLAILVLISIFVSLVVGIGSEPRS